MKKVYFDTNIILDIALNRKPFVNDALKLIELIENNKIIGFVNSLSIVSVHYIISKNKGKDIARQFIKDILQFFDIVNVDKNIIINALNSNFKDFEDSVQEFSAKNSGIEIILTRNSSDFKNSNLQIFEPSQFTKLKKNNSIIFFLFCVTIKQTTKKRSARM